MPGCHTQAKSLDELMERVKEAVELYLERLWPEESLKIARKLKLFRRLKTKVGKF